MSRQPAPSRFRRLAAAARRASGRNAGSHRCPDCGRPFVCPIEWETAGDDHWRISTRCGECGAWHEQLLSNEDAKRLDLILNDQTAEIADQLTRMDRERMRTELDAFVAALDADLIDATDFAR
jgi:hypothetical protein